LLAVARLEFTSAAVAVQVVSRPMLDIQSLHHLQSQSVQVEQVAAETLLEALTAQIQLWMPLLRQVEDVQAYLTEPLAPKLEQMEVLAVALVDLVHLLLQVVRVMSEKETMAVRLRLLDLVLAVAVQE
jgi:hypothetical protein